MSLYVQVGRKSYEVPREVEAEGGLAVERWVASQVAGPKKATATPRPSKKTKPGRSAAAAPRTPRQERES